MFKKCLFICCILFSFSHAEMKEACEVVYQGDLNDLNDSTVVVPEVSVAFSSLIKVVSTMDSITGGSPPSIFFVIDESGSMFGSDRIGLRYSTTAWFIDTVMTIYPAAEVGMALFADHLWFDRNDDDLFIQCPGYTMGAYMPLLKLNELYGAETGQEVLKKYIEIDTMFTPPAGMIIYEPSTFNAGIFTNINVGITSAKHAFAHASYKKRERHFLIFLSDGGACEANGPETSPTAYVNNADSLPTTFTVFLTENNQAPQQLIDFTENVKVNGYSTINHKSNIWSIQSDTLKEHLINNVISIVLGGISVNPDTLSINGLVNHYYDTINQVFTFDHHFPLLGVNTDFTYGIDYTVVKDSVDTATGDTIHIVYDTSVTGDYVINIQDGAPLPTHYPDTFRLDCWEREIVFYYSNNPINFVDETMNPIEIRFNYNPGVANYNYTNATLEITNSSGNGRDKETITLTKNGTTFTGTFPRALIANSATPSQGDGTLQHYATDNIVATFRNNEQPKLPLDTLVEQIPFNFGGTVVIDSAFYFDNNAEGYVDSIYVAATNNISGGLTNAHVKEILDSAITFPAFRNFTINNYSVTQGGFYITVSEDDSHNPFTYTTTDDRLIVTERFLSAGGMVAARDVPIFDRVAPIIHWEPMSALLKDYYISSRSDTLGVKFSEPINSVTSDEPFNFLNWINSTNYVVILNALDQPEPDSMVFEVVSVSGVDAMKDGDSLWIQEPDKVTDMIGNSQNNPDNIKRRLYVDKIYGSLEITKAYYFDRTADGYVDSIYIETTTDIEGGLTASHVSELIINDVITFPLFRDFTATGSGLTNGGFYVIVTEDEAHNPFTYVTDEDRLQIANYSFTTGGAVKSKIVAVYDRVAPIIHWEKKAAFLVDYMIDTISDTLTVKFSEPIERVTSDEPFYFLDMDNNANYEARLSDVSQPEPDKMVFYVTSLSGVDYMEEGDSLWIHETDRVSDVEGNYQNNINNTRRKLYVKKVVMPYTFIPKAVSPIDLTNMHTHIIPNEIISVLQSQNIIGDLHLQQNNTGSYTGMLIMVVPDPENIGEFLPDLELEGRLSIYDAVGNQVVARSEMAWWDEKKSLVYVWNIKNENSRTVGPGVYLSLIELEDVTESLGYQNRGPKEVKKLFLGVGE